MAHETHVDEAAVRKEAARQDALARKALDAAAFRKAVAEARTVHADAEDEAEIVRDAKA